MKEIINGVCYDTEKAVLIEFTESEFKKEDIRWSVTRLYRTKSGQYFLYGIGSPGSPYAQPDDIHTYTEGEMIIPMTLNKVTDWAEEYLSDKGLKNILKDMERNLKRLGLEVPTYLKTSLLRLGKRERDDKLAAAKKAKYSQKTCRITYVRW